MTKKKMSWSLTGCVLAMCLLAGCGQAPVSDSPLPEQPDNMLDASQWDGAAGESHDTGSDTGGYELDVEAGTAVLENLKNAYDQSTVAEAGSSDEFSMLYGSSQEPSSAEPAGPAQLPDGAHTEIGQEPVACDAAPAPVPILLKPEASGIAAMSNSSCAIDYSNIQDGYFMAKWSAQPQKIKLQSTGPSGTTYTYDLYGNEWSVFPLSDGNGSYDIRVMQCVGGSKYAVAGSVQVQADMADAFAPFLRPNQYVNYENAPNTTAQASECCRGLSSELEKVAAVYDWVVANLSYDHEKARTVQSGYLPDLDAVLSARKGICFDYGALMAAMLRSQGVACRLVVGYAGSAYHAWISVYVDGEGWVDGVIFFDGLSWQRMDPTFASSSHGSAEIMAYIGDGSNYSARYLY